MVVIVHFAVAVAFLLSAVDVASAEMVAVVNGVEAVELVVAPAAAAEGVAAAVETTAAAAVAAIVVVVAEAAVVVHAFARTAFQTTESTRRGAASRTGSTYSSRGRKGPSWRGLRVRSRRRRRA